MINDFLKVNLINAKLAVFPTDSNFDKAVSFFHVSNKACAKAVPFINKKNQIFSLIVSQGEECSAAKACKVFDQEVFVVDSTECLKRTGFEKNFFPPIGVFGAITKFSKEAEGLDLFLFAISKREFMLISAEELKKAVELSEELGFF